MPDVPVRWGPTPSFARALLVGAVGVAAGVVLGSPVVVVLAAPLALHGVLAWWHRPRATTHPRIAARLDHRSLHEGQGTTSRLSVEPATDVEHVARAMQPAPHLAFGPTSGVLGGLAQASVAPWPAPVAGPGAAAPTGPVVEISARRWGRRVLGAELVALTSPWAGYRCGPVRLDGTLVRVLPATATFGARAPAPRPRGLVGAHRSQRLGAGAEFADIRPFRVGDRLRRINWRVSARTDELHVTTSPAEQDTGVLLVIDALADHGRSGGVDGEASSLDRTVRAASALAEYYLYAGDRVGVRVVGGDGGLVASGAGSRHLRMIRDTLAGLRPGDLPEGIASRIQLRVRGGNLVFVLSAMLDPAIVTATASLARRGFPVVVVDTLPDDAVPDVADRVSPAVVDLAWRMRRLERDQVLAALAVLGCPAVPWRGPGTLDEVLLRLGRQTRAPNVAR